MKVDVCLNVVVGMKVVVCLRERETESFNDNLLVRIHFIIVMIRRTGLAPWDFEFLVQVALSLPPGEVSLCLTNSVLLIINFQVGSAVHIDRPSTS